MTYGIEDNRAVRHPRVELTSGAAPAYQHGARRLEANSGLEDRHAANDRTFTPARPANMSQLRLGSFHV